MESDVLECQVLAMDTVIADHAGYVIRLAIHDGEPGLCRSRWNLISLAHLEEVSVEVLYTQRLARSHQYRPTAVIYLIEARLRTDTFEAGLPSEGVVAYEIQEAHWAPVHLRTPVALVVQQSYSDYMNVTVMAAVPGGFTIEVTYPVVVVPDLTDDTLADAELAVATVGLRLQASGTGRVVAQRPMAGTGVPKGSIVEVTLQDWVEVPDLTDDTLSEAEQLVKAAGLVLQTTGTGNYVAGQRPVAGARVIRGTTVHVTLKPGPRS